MTEVIFWVPLNPYSYGRKTSAVHPVSCVVCDVFSPVWVGLFALTKYAGIVKAHITTSPTSRVCFEYPKDASPFCVGMMEKHKPERHSSRHSRSLRKDTEASMGRRSAYQFSVSSQDRKWLEI